MELNQLIERKQDLRTLPPPPQFIKQRIATAAEQINRAGSVAARVEVANEALSKLAVMLYAEDSDGVLANIDARTYRLLVPSPWGSAGWKRWGLRKWEAVTLRAILIRRVTKSRLAPPLDYNMESKTWHLNLDGYPTPNSALDYFKQYPITLGEWRYCTE